MARTGSSSTEAAASSSASASPPSSVSNNPTNNSSSDPSRPPSGVVMASASAATATAAAAVAAAAAASATASSSMSISDLVPLSMSVLRDKMMADLIAEHEALKMKLKQQQEDRLRVEVIGPGGTYCRASLKDGVTVMPSDDNPRWDIDLNHSGDRNNNTNSIIPNFIETVAGLEVRVGGVVIFPFKTARFCIASAEDAGFNRTRDDTRQMGFVGFHNDNGVVVLGRVGPILYEDYINLRHSLPPQVMKVTDLVRFLNNHQTNNNDTVLLSQLKVERVAFPKSQIPGVFLLLEDTLGGLSTSE